MRNWKPLLGLITTVMVSACRDPLILDDVPEGQDVSDASSDVMTDSGRDTGSPMDVPSGSDAMDVLMDAPSSMDVTGDVGSDVGADVPSDAGADANMMGDGGGPTLSPALIPEARVTCGPRTAAPTVTAGAADRYVLRGRVVTPTGVLSPGEVFVTGTTITCVAASCASSPQYAGSTIVETGGVIYPGIVDAHNHVAYDFLPPWMAPRLYSNRGQWQSSTAYSTFIDPYRVGSTDHYCAMGKYGEVRALMGGTTSIQGVNNRRCVTRTLVRNIEHGPDFNNMDVVRTNILEIASVDAATAATIRSQMNAGTVQAYIIHLSEGIDEPSRMEFDELVSKNLLAPATVIIHGTAFGASEFQQLGTAGGKLVWSPRSNVILYGRTTDVPTARSNNIPVSLAPDWTPSGGPDMFSEMRYARYVSSRIWNGLLTSRDLFEMTTSRPAAATARATFVGALQVGLQADVLVLPDYGCDAYDTFVNGVPAEIALVMIAGRPLYGDTMIMSGMPASLLPDCESVNVCMRAKTVCVSKGAGAADGTDQTLASIDTEIRTFYGTPYPLVANCPP